MYVENLYAGALRLAKSTMSLKYVHVHNFASSEPNVMLEVGGCRWWLELPSI